MTIRRGTKKAKEVISNAHNIMGYSLANNFAGNPLTDKPVVWGGPVLNGRFTELVPVTQQQWLQHELDTLPFARLTWDGDIKRYRLEVHSNLWYEFEA